ncbi:Hypothetical protein FKW44_004576 [Caligus rogercresseyi]|uniref:Uncharacterized protein n=1 Tax=Caligus rogercresseyi TaxID=217165 RepID=A0A7T8KB29_CALRO|nr:Hypothetical protein FKW44_004576 [Caligus rogercresseyi]
MVLMRDFLLAGGVDPQSFDFEEHRGTTAGPKTRDGCLTRGSGSYTLSQRE